jgi:tetratricopeptide (TPR) repeat protein
VLDSRRGVCLGVSLLYLALAQRLNLELEIITPPGHIFVRYAKGKEKINIETTARGIHLPDAEYLGVDTRALQQRTIKETVGMSWYNQAAVYWERQEFDKVLEAYNRAEKYMPSDNQLIELKGCCALILGEEELSRNLLKQVIGCLPEYAVSRHTIAQDYFSNAVGADGIKSLYIPVDETRASLLAKKEKLQEIVKKYPRFREGLLSLAGTWLQLHRMKEALGMLKQYHQLDSQNVAVEYYLAALYAERMDYNHAWKHFRTAEKLAEERGHHPKALADLRKELSRLSPE